MGLKKNNPGCDCCGASANCDHCTGTSPATIVVEIDGYTDGDCDSCAEEMNGSHILVRGTTEPGACLFVKTWVCCTGEEVYPCSVTALVSATEWTVRASTGFLSFVEYTSGGHTAPIDCTAEYTLSYNDKGELSPGYCDFDFEDPPAWTINPT